MNNELWKEIENYDNYMISNFGNVKNVKTGRILKTCADKDGYLTIGLMRFGTGKTHKIHKLVAGAFLIKPDNEEQVLVDHINRQRHDNHYLNLRWVSKSQNNQNSSKQHNTISIYKGVSFNKVRNKFFASIRINGKKKHLGYFETERDGAIAYNTACDIYFGEYGNKNIISDDE